MDCYTRMDVHIFRDCSHNHRTSVTSEFSFTYAILSVLQWLSISSFLHLDEDRTFDWCFQIKADNVPETDESFFVNLTSVTSLPFDGDLGMYTLHEFTYFKVTLLNRYMGPKAPVLLRNSLTTSLKHTDSITAFKRGLKTYLFRQ